MDNKILKSSIKAYCRELLETSTSGGAGGYLTKKAFRKPKKQDKNSPTGFESSPKPNMYTKTMKFKIVDPSQRLNSKDLWKGEHLEEIKINQPIFRAKLMDGDKNDILVHKRGVNYNDEIEQSLKDQGQPIYETNPNYTYSLISFPEWKNPTEKFWWIDDEIDFPSPTNEIKVNNPNIKFPLKIEDFQHLEGIIPLLKADGYQSRDYEGDPVDIDNILNNYDKFFNNEHIKYLDPINTGSKILRIKYEDELNLNESRYAQFKKSTSKPKPKDILHRAIKEIQMKLDEVNRLIEFTTRIKGELTENDQEIEYLKRTKDSLYKIQDKLKEAFSNISKINEIKINNPNETEFPIRVNNKEDLDREILLLIKKGFEPDWEEYKGEYPTNIFGDKSSFLFLHPNEEVPKYKIKLSEIKINKPMKIWDFNKYDPNFTPDKIKVGDRIISRKIDFVVDDIVKDNNVDDINFYGKDPKDSIYGANLIFANNIRKINN